MNISWIFLAISAAVIIAERGGYFSLFGWKVNAVALGVLLILWQIAHLVARNHTPRPRDAKLPALPPLTRGPFRGTVTQVFDGDTIDVKTTSGIVRVRLFGLDAPEMGQPFGDSAKHALSKMIIGRELAIHPVTVDRYNRVVAFIGNPGESVNLALVKDGIAWATPHDDTPPNYHAAQREAMRLAIGLWKLPKPIPPWDWRAVNG